MGLDTNRQNFIQIEIRIEIICCGNQQQIQKIDTFQKQKRFIFNNQFTTKSPGHAPGLIFALTYGK